MKTLNELGIGVRAVRPGYMVAMLSLATCSLLVGREAQAQTFTLYDDFSAGFINPYKWEGEEGKQYGAVRVEARRAVASGQLFLDDRGYGDYHTDAGLSSTRNSVAFARPATITAIRATITMTAAAATSCSTNTTPSAARARIFGFFFNAGTPVPGSNYNDVYAGIQLLRASNSADPAGTLRVSAFVGVCTDDSCIGSTTLAVQDLGPASLGAPVVLQVAWNKASSLFSFVRDSNAPVDLAYTVTNSGLASFPAKRLEISNQIAHCTSSPRPTAHGSANFDDVMIY